MSDAITDAILRALRGLRGSQPRALLRRVDFELEDAGEAPLDEEGLVDILTTSDANDVARVEFQIQLNRWDSAEDEGWAFGTLQQSDERRDKALGLLGFSSESAKRVNEAFPLDLTGSVVIADKAADWDPWYTDEFAEERSFYWDGYRSVLEKKMSGTAVAELDRTTREVVRRLADPSRSDQYQSKGLVVGHVQSGKTANFTGVIAKAIDAGYRLVIVLTGTIELLRSQTQRRIDMELVGQENILGGVDPDDADQVADIDYIGNQDRDWLDGKFVAYGKHPKDLGKPAVRRLTRATWDFRRLQAGLDTLDFRQTDAFADPAKPLYDPVNLHRSDVRLAVVKKNKTVLEKLVKDLQAIRTNLGEIPALIIDDEADQASINTTSPRNQKTKEETERTAINKLIAQLLKELPRAQYIGYTATPFANVFVDPEDAEDIFPKDFIVSLDPPAAYMGGRDFHDLERDVDTGDDEGDFATSNQKAFVRDLWAGADDDEARRAELQGAIDAFVLSGAIKLFRADALGEPGKFRHHTMLVHESVKQVEHAALRDVIRDVWLSAGYSTPKGLRRLYELWRDDFALVTAARAPESPAVEEWNTLVPYVGKAVDKIRAGHAPVVIVNGAADKDYVQDDIDFQKHDVWKILVGGAKLSRGFTVEGLTTSYYTRRTAAADTLMQMGRWFGYRPEYKDLVRLYIGRNVPGPQKGTFIDLYRWFEAIVRDEEDFREELRTFRGFDEEGRPKVRPMDVPPLVYQSLPHLTPTSRNKMYNAELTMKGEGGRVQDFFQQPPHDDDINLKHFQAVRPLLDAALDYGDFFHIEAEDGRFSTYPAKYGVVPAHVLLDVVRKFEWVKNGAPFLPALSFMEDAIAAGTLTDWAIIVPELARKGTNVAIRQVHGQTLHVLKRTRREDRGWAFSGSSPRQRDALEVISSGIEAPHLQYRDQKQDVLREPEFAHLRALRKPTRGAFLLTFAADARGDNLPMNPTELPDPADPGHIAALFSLAFPRKAAPGGRIAFRVKREGAGAIVDAE